MASKASSASSQASPKVPNAASAKKVVSAQATKKATPPASVPLKAKGKTPSKALIPTSESSPTPAKAAKPAKLKKPKLIRDSFTIPKDEYAVIDALKLRAGQLSSATKKSELIRAGIKALAAMGDGAFLGALKQVPVIKTGRPAKAKAS